MKRFVLYVTNKCNFKCGHCLRGESANQDISMSDIEKALPLIRSLGVKTVSLTGGEPILCDRFEDIIKLLVKNNMKIGVVTNAWLYEDYLKTLEPYKQNVEYIAISLDGHNSKTHDAVRAKGSFDRAISAIKSFREHGYFIRVCHIINKVNCAHVLDFLNYMKPYDIEVGFGKIIPSEYNVDWQITPEQMATLKTKIKFAMKAYKFLVLTSTLGPNNQLQFCRNFQTMNDVTLRYDGKVIFCCDATYSSDGLILGDIRKESFEKIMPRFGILLGHIIEKRLESVASGSSEKTNNCEFCNNIFTKSLFDV